MFVLWCWLLVQFIEGLVCCVFTIVFPSTLGQTEEDWVKIPKLFVGVFKQSVAHKRLIVVTAPELSQKHLSICSSQAEGIH